ncbi:hypothetical protein B0T17DRAFT_579812 [Bombardia bombarda]|uniref:Peptidase M20 dimerisation domain-containing protein n=1 Tax=Bombardia bombarda TaxID=252184 RepID=A0AA39WUH6_9PEZI|nr:hypothetical protein B0T17DRAFT_579812 [Bombardia bombarda]
MEKPVQYPGLPTASGPPTAKRELSRTRKVVVSVFALLVTAYLFAPIAVAAPQAPWSRPAPNFASQCKQPDPLFPSPNDKADKLYEAISSEAFKNASIERLSGAVRVKSVSYDGMGEVGADPRWDVFYDFAAYLDKTFPLIYKHLDVEKVNTHGLLYTWKGSNPALKPTLLMAHQDTVPVPPETLSAWIHPPWGGVYDGRYIWGRGASDCKNQLIAALETIELLIQADFAPKRTILLSFGFDEESSGDHGAKKLSAFIQDRYGKDSLAVIVDEGATFETTWGTVFAKPGTAEKGATDVSITVRMPGGHSSIPADHTSIGVLAELITQIESAQYPTSLAEINPYYAQLQCGAAHSPSFPATIKKLLSSRSPHKKTCAAAAGQDRLALEAARLGGAEIKYLMQTSQAVDVITGGAKVNALPERASVTINHRINLGDGLSLVYDRLTALAGPIADKYNLTLNAFDGKEEEEEEEEKEEEEEPSSITLAAPHAIDIAPVTPADASRDRPYAVLAGTTRAVYGEEVVVTPGIMTGNTDTRFYWDLTRHIFRFGPGYDPEDQGGILGDGIHTVNERVSVAGHVNAVRWFLLFVRNMDEADV